MRKANMLIITLFLVLACGLIGLIISRYVFQLLASSGELGKYYKAYYVALGGVELSLTKIKNHSYGFEDTITGGSVTNTNRHQNQKLELSINSTSPVVYDERVLSGADAIGYSVLKKGNGYIVPLFRDGESEKEYPLSGGTTLEKKLSVNDVLVSVGSGQYTGVVSILRVGDTFTDFSSITSGNVIFTGSSNPKEYTLKNLWNSIGSDVDSYYNPLSGAYLIIANLTGDDMKWSLSGSSHTVFPTPYVTIYSYGKFGDRVVGIKSIKRKTVPDYLIYTTLSSD